MNIHWIYCIKNIFTLQNFWATCACLQKQFPAKFSLYWIYFLPFKIFEQLCAHPEKQSLPWIFHCIQYTFCIQDFLATCSCPEFSVLDIYFSQWRAVRFVTGEALSLSKPNLRVIWIEWRSINSPLNWLLSEWLLLMLSITYHTLLHT